METLQLRLNTNTPEQIKHSWAFAAYKRRSKARAKGRTVITAVSREAKQLGIQAGMAVTDAKLLLPELKVLVYNRR